MFLLSTSNNTLSIDGVYLFSPLPKYNLLNNSLTLLISVTSVTLPFPNNSLKKLRIFLKMLFVLGAPFKAFPVLTYSRNASAKFSSISSFISASISSTDLVGTNSFVTAFLAALKSSVSLT